MDAAVLPSTVAAVGGFLLDIEGTLASIQFVHDKMFPYVRSHLEAFLRDNDSCEELNRLCQQIVAEADERLPGGRCDLREEPDRSAVTRAVNSLMDRDAKVTGLKQLQGMIWKEGFHSGQLRAVVFDDVLPFLQTCCQRRIPVRIYSSGSIAAQQLFFGHTQHGSLLSYFDGHYDTNVGSKMDVASYRRIAQDFACDPDPIVYVSDSVAELDAAQQAGLRTVLCERPGNPPAPCNHAHARWPGSFLSLGVVSP